MLYWDIIDNKAEKAKSDRAIIQEIGPKPTKVHCSGNTKSMMLQGIENPCTTAYLVDVTAKFLPGNPDPTAYIVEAVYEDFEMPKLPT